MAKYTHTYGGVGAPVGLTVFKTAGGSLGAAPGGFDSHTPLPLHKARCLSNSPRIRSAPQSRFCAAISLIKVTIPVDILGCVAWTCDLCFQNRRNASRRHRSSVSG